MNKLPFAFRASTPEDRAYVLKSWLMTWRSEEANRKLPNKVYFQQANSLFGTIFDRYGAVIACNANIPEQIYAFAIAAYLPDDEWVLFWIQTKSLYQNLGISKELFKFIKKNHTHGPICPFIRVKSINYMNKYDVLDAPYSVANILAMPITDSPTKELNE